MQVKLLVVLVTVFFEATIARRCRRPQPPNISSRCGLQRQCYDDVLPLASVSPCGYKRPRCYGDILPPMLDCECVRPRCYDEMLLPMLECGCVRPRCYDEMFDCGYVRPTCYDYEVPMLTPVLECGCVRATCNDGLMSPPRVECGRSRPRCYDELVLPPMRVEVPCGLGYFPSAVPLVASFFNPAVEVGACAGASVTVTSPCSGLVLATPVCPDIAPLVRSVIL